MSLDSDDEGCFERALTPTQLEAASRRSVEMAESLKALFPPNPGKLHKGRARRRGGQLTIEHFVFQNIERARAT